MKGKGLIFVLVFSLAINASILAAMGYHYYRDASSEKDTPCPLSPSHQHLYQQLNLSAAQLAEMDPLARTFHERLAKLGTVMEAKNSRLVNLLAQEKADPGLIEELRNEMASIQDEIQKEVIAHILEFKKILDPQQQEHFFVLMRKAGPSERLNR